MLWSRDPVMWSCLSSYPTTFHYVYWLYLSIALFLTTHFFNTSNPIHLFLGIGFPTSHHWKAHQLLSLRHATAVSIPTHQHLVCWDSTFLHPDLLEFGSSTKFCDWWRSTKQNQPRIALALGEYDSSLKRRCQALGNLCDKAQDARHARRSKTWLSGVCLTLLQEKLVIPMLL